MITDFLYWICVRICELLSGLWFELVRLLNNVKSVVQKCYLTPSSSAWNWWVNVRLNLQKVDNDLSTTIRTSIYCLNSSSVWIESEINYISIYFLDLELSIVLFMLWIFEIHTYSKWLFRLGTGFDGNWIVYGNQSPYKIRMCS